MKKLVVAFTILSMAAFSALSQNTSKKSETGFMFGIGNTFLVNDYFDNYYKRSINSMIDYAISYRINYPENRFSLKYEYTMQAFSSPYQFNDTYKGIAEQGFMGMNVKGSINKKDKPEIRVFEFFFGPGLYMVSQNRIPEPASGLNEINDGVVSYFGVSFNGEFLTSIPLDKYHVGFSWRIFLLPNITFFNRNSTPEFYHFGTSLGFFTSF